MAALDHGNIVRLYGKYHDIDLVFCIGVCVCPIVIATVGVHMESQFCLS